MNYASLYRPTTHYILRHACLVVLEGVDGSGKSTVLKHIGEHLKEQKRVVFYKEPPERHRRFSEIHKAAQYGNPDPEQEHIFRRATLERVLQMVQDVERLDEPDTVILADRFIPSTVTHQANNLLRYRYLRSRLSYLGIGKPHYTICITPPKIHLDRFYRLLQTRFQARENDPILPFEEYKRMVCTYNDILSGDPHALLLNPFSDYGALRSVNGNVKHIARWMSENP